MAEAALPVPIHDIIAAAGGPSALARAFGDLSPQAISQWRRVPDVRVLTVERVTGISRHTIRPDIYGPAPGSADRAPEAGPDTGIASSGPVLREGAPVS